MTTPFQICIDADDPHRLNRFWAAAMGYEIEDHHDQVKQLVDEGHASADDTTEIDGRLAWRTAVASWDPAGVASAAGPTGARAQDREEPSPPRSACRRGPRREAEVERLTSLGASRLWDGQQGPHRWVTMADPEGNEFCVA